MIKFLKKYKSDIFLILGIVVLATLITYNVTRLSLKKQFLYKKKYKISTS